MFVDDCALNMWSACDMQDSLELFSTACYNFGPTISIMKTVVMYQPAPQKPYQEPTVTVNNQTLSAVDKFTYLGSTLSCILNINDDTDIRVAKTFSRHRSSIQDQKGISLTTKLKVYRAVVLSALLHASETWTVYQQHAKKLNHFHLWTAESEVAK